MNQAERPEQNLNEIDASIIKAHFSVWNEIVQAIGEEIDKDNFFDRWSDKAIRRHLVSFLNVPEATNISLLTSISTEEVSLFAGVPNVAMNLCVIRSYIFASLSAIFPISPVGYIAGCAGSIFLPSFGFNVDGSDAINFSYFNCFDSFLNIFLKSNFSGNFWEDVLGYDINPFV